MMGVLPSASISLLLTSDLGQELWYNMKDLAWILMVAESRGTIRHGRDELLKC
jgi:hypothetical protein